MRQEFEQQKLKRVAEVEGRQSKVFSRPFNCELRSLPNFSRLIQPPQKADKRKRRKENAKKKG